MTRELPWQPRTQSMKGRQIEPQLAKKRGARAHPNSGAGRIKDDASNEDTVFEFKLAARTHSIKGSDLAALFKRAAEQGKDAEYTIYFEDEDITLIGRVEKGKQ